MNEYAVFDETPVLRPFLHVSGGLFGIDVDKLRVGQEVRINERGRALKYTIAEIKPSRDGGADLYLDPILDEVQTWAADQARAYAKTLNDARERQARRLVIESLRPRLRWLVDHPRLLKLLYRVVPSWRPERRVYVGTTAAPPQ
jgi:hypothetical protein